jgi:hypothetical protein
VYSHRQSRARKLHTLPAVTEHSAEFKSYLHHVDQGLSILLEAYQLPVFVIGSKTVTSEFRQISKNPDHIIACINGSYANASEHVTFGLIQPFLANWEEIRMKMINRRIEKAKEEGKIHAGIGEALEAARHKNCRLLLVEKEFRFPENAEEYYLANEERGRSNDFFIKDRVDEIIGSILSNGGEVEFVDSGALGNYGHILILQ